MNGKSDIILQKFYMHKFILIVCKWLWLWLFQYMLHANNSYIINILKNNLLILLISYSWFYVLLNEIKPTGILTKIPYTLHRTVKINAYDFDVHWRFSSVCQTPKYYYFSIINSAVRNLGRSIQNYLSTNFTPRKMDYYWYQMTW